MPVDIAIIVVIDDPQPKDEIEAAMVEDFERLINELDLKCIMRPGWERLQSILTMATMMASNAEGGAAAYARALEGWRLSRYYDGRD